MNVLSILGYCLAAAGGLGIAAAVFYQNRARAIIELLQTENSTKDTKITRLETEAVKSQAEIEAYKVRVAGFEKLPDYSKISRQITTQHKEVMLILGGIMKSLTGGKSE